MRKCENATRQHAPCHWRFVHALEGWGGCVWRSMRSLTLSEGVRVVLVWKAKRKELCMLRPYVGCFCAAGCMDGWKCCYTPRAHALGRGRSRKVKVKAAAVFLTVALALRERRCNTHCWNASLSSLPSSSLFLPTPHCKSDNIFLYDDRWWLFWLGHTSFSLKWTLPQAVVGFPIFDSHQRSPFSRN